MSSVQQAVHDPSVFAAAVVKVLAEDKLEQFADRLQTRILEGREEKGKSAEHVTKQQQEYCDFAQNNAQSFQKFLDKSGGPVCSCPNPDLGNLHGHALCCVALRVWLLATIWKGLLKKALIHIPAAIQSYTPTIHSSEKMLRRWVPL